MRCTGVFILNLSYVWRRADAKWRNLCAATGLLLLSACAAMPGSMDSAAPPGAIVASSLPVSVADEPQAAALRTAPRIALVIGNEHYSNWKLLHLPGADARAMAQTLGARGFTLIGGGAQIDVSSTKFYQLVNATEAAVRANPGAIVAIYFAGHGFADEGHN